MRLQAARDGAMTRDEKRAAVCSRQTEERNSEGGRMRLETLVEVKFLNSSCSSLPSFEIRQTVPCRAIRGNGISVNSTLPPSQPLRVHLCGSLGCTANSHSRISRFEVLRGESLYLRATAAGVLDDGGTDCRQADLVAFRVASCVCVCVCVGFHDPPSYALTRISEPSYREWAVTFIPMPMPKRVCRTFSWNKWVQHEVCIVFVGRGHGYEYHGPERVQP